MELGLSRVDCAPTGPLRDLRPVGQMQDERRNRPCAGGFPERSPPSQMGRLMAMADVSGVRREVNVA